VSAAAEAQRRLCGVRVTETFWTWLVIRISGPDALALPTYGPSGQTREQAHADVAKFLATAPPEGEPVRKRWAAGAKDDTVYFTTPDGMIVFAILPYAGDRPGCQLAAVEEWLEDFNAGLRAATPGFDAQVSWSARDGETRNDDQDTDA
jgi:hypothetical protein